MKERSAKQMVMDNLDQLEDAEEAMLIIAHEDGTISWHDTTEILHKNLGLVNYVKVCLEENIRHSSMIDEEPTTKEVLQ